MRKLAGDQHYFLFVNDYGDNKVALSTVTVIDENLRRQIVETYMYKLCL